jgi:hypothetical protein
MLGAAAKRGIQTEARSKDKQRIRIFFNTRPTLCLSPQKRGLIHHRDELTQFLKILNKPGKKSTLE